MAIKIFAMMIKIYPMLCYTPSQESRVCAASPQSARASSSTCSSWEEDTGSPLLCPHT